MTSKERKEGRYQRRKADRLKNKYKRYYAHGIYDDVFTYDNLYNAYMKSKKGVMWKASTQRYKANALLNVFHDYELLTNRKYKSKGFYEFDIKERGKARHIKSVHISERIVQKCLCDQCITPMFSQSLIYDNGASLKGKGIDFSLNRLDAHLHRHYRKHGAEGYVLLFDFSKYFDNVSHQVLSNEIKKQPIDHELKALTNYFIAQFGKQGLGLGSQVSQINALLLPNTLDHFIKEKLQIKGYGRYMDDGYLIHHSKEYLKECLVEIKKICQKLGIILNEKKTQIVKLNRGFIFLKMRYNLTYNGKVIRRINKESIVRTRKKLKAFAVKYKNGEMLMSDIECSYESWKGHIKRSKSYNAKINMDLLYKQLFTMSD